MSSVLYLFITNTDSAKSSAENKTAPPALSWVVDNGNNDLVLNQGSLMDAAKACASHTVTVVLPGEKVLFLTAQVPGKNIQKVLQAIPYVLEDSVIDDVDDLYFSIKKQNSDASNNQYDVSIINKNYFESIIKTLEAAGIYADAMIADYFLLTNKPSLFVDEKRVIYSSSEMKFSSAVESSIKLDSKSYDESTKLKLITCNKSSNIETPLSNLIENINVAEEQCEINPLVYLVKNRSNNTINLLHGVYKKKKDWSQAGKTWLPVSVLLGVWLVIQTGIFVFDYIDLSKKNKLINIEIIKIYKKTFPKSRRIVDAKAQMQQKLSSIKKRNGQSGRSFTEMLSNSASVFSKTKGLEIKSLRYYDGKINLEIQISSLQALDKLGEKLNKEKGYQVEVQNASSGKETVTARLQIVGAGS